MKRFLFLALFLFLFCPVVFSEPVKALLPPERVSKSDLKDPFDQSSFESLYDQYMFEQNMNVHSFDSALSWVKKGSLRSIEISRICKQNQGNECGWNELHYAAKEGDLKKIKALVETGFFVDQAAKGGWTPYHLAREYKQMKAAELLLSLGANPNLKNNSTDSEPVRIAENSISKNEHSHPLLREAYNGASNSTANLPQNEGIPGVTPQREIVFVPVPVPVLGGGGNTYVGVGDETSIQSISDGGRIITLLDNSVWEVSPLDTVDTAIWLPVTDVIIIDGDEPGFPYKMINKDDNEVANVKILSH